MADEIELKPIEYRKMLMIMKVEAQNELLKTQILERITARRQIAGGGHDQALGMLQQKVRTFEMTIKDLEDFLKDEAKVAPKSESGIIEA